VAQRRLRRRVAADYAHGRIYGAMRRKIQAWWVSREPSISVFNIFTNIQLARSCPSAWIVSKTARNASRKRRWLLVLGDQNSKGLTFIWMCPFIAHFITENGKCLDCRAAHTQFNNMNLSLVMHPIPERKDTTWRVWNNKHLPKLS
jgi:hypothetical protein